MGMGVDEGWHDNAAPGVQDLGLRVLGPEGGLLADLHDGRALIGHGAVLIVAFALAVPGDESAVGE